MSDNNQKDLDDFTDALQVEADRLHKEMGLDSLQIIAAYTNTDGEECSISAGSGSVLARRGLTDWLLSRWRHLDKDDKGCDE